MFRKIKSKFLGLCILCSVAGAIVVSQDIASEPSITGNSSAFVFRGSSKKRQMRATSAPTFLASTTLDRRIQPKKASGRTVVQKRQPARASRAVRAEALAANAEALLDSGRIDESITAFRDAAGLNPKNSRAIFGLSDALSAKGVAVSAAGDDEAAMVSLNESIKLNPKNDFALAEMGEISFRKREYDPAILNYEAALAVNPDTAQLNVPLGFAYLEKGDIDSADTCLVRVEKAGIIDREVSNLRGMIRFRQGRPEEALAAFEETIRTNGRDPMANYYRGVLYDQAGRTQLSTESYRAALDEQPEMSEAWLDLGVRYYNAGDYDQALAAYQRVVSIQPGNSQAHANLASTFRQLERYQEANAEYKLAEAGIKNDPDLYSEWGFCLGKTQEWDKALLRLQTAQGLSPNSVDYTNTGWGYYNAAIQDRDNNRPVEAEAKLRSALLVLEKAVESDPRLTPAFLNLGSTHNALGQHDSAAEALNKALSLENDWVVALNQLGIANRGLGDLKAAIRNFERATTLEPNSVFGLQNLGDVYVLNGDKRKARRVRDRLRPLDRNMADRLDKIISGDVILEDAKRKLRNKVPGIFKFPY